MRLSSYLSRFKCGLGCAVEFASRNYVGAKIHRDDCPTRAFLASGWRPEAKSEVANKGLFFRTEAPIEGNDECLCSSAHGTCKVAHIVL